MSKDSQQPQDPEQFLGQVSYQLAHSDNYLMGPYAQMSAGRKFNERQDVAARLIGDHVEYNADKLQAMGINDASVQIKGLVVHQALLHMERRRMLSGGLPQYESVADLASELATWHKLEYGRWKVSDKFPKPNHFQMPEHLSMEEYFKLLVQKAGEQGVDLSQVGQPQSQPGQGQGGGGQGEEEQEGEGGGEQQEQNSPAQQLAKALGGKQEYHKQDNSQWHQISKVQQEAMQQSLPDKIEAWMKSRGIEPAGLQRLIEEIRRTAEEKWYDKLRNLIGSKLTSQKYRYTVKRPSRRHGIPHAGRQRLRKGLLAVAVDTSGSISMTELEIFISKLHQIAKAYQMPFEVIICDADIHAIKKVAKKRDIEAINLKGGGGTSSLPVFNYLEKRPVDLLVYLTDLEIDFPEEQPKYRVIWGVINPRRYNDPNLKAPFGDTHHLRVDEDEDQGYASRRRRK